MKKILGLDLGTTSIGWAIVNESENENEQSSIVKTGVRVVPLTTDESTDFAKGKAATINAERTLKRGARRNLQRYKQRRKNLLDALSKNNFISKETVIAEEGKNSTHSLWELRAKAATEQISLEDFARVLLAINKKRGYKSNRKAKDDAEGVAIDGMEVALKLYNDNLTPGQYVLDLLKNDKKYIPDFYRSDLQGEFDKIWNYQKQYYAELLTDDLKNELFDKNKKATWAICKEPFNLVGKKRTTKGRDLKKENYQWRVNGLSDQLSLEQLAVVLQEINNQKNSSSGYLGEISDRSKELHFNKETVGQNLYNQLLTNPHTRLKNQVFYRQDYLDEFEKIWEKQASFYKELTIELKEEIRDIVIFYQRRLKSQKGLISICELEGKERELHDKEGNPILNVKGEPKRKIVGPRVIPKSSPLFQEYKIWQILNNIQIRNKITKEIFVFDIETKKELFEELNVKGKLSNNQILKLVVPKPKDWELNYKDGIEGSSTNEALYKAYQTITELSGHDNINFAKLSAIQIKEVLESVFETIGINKAILNFNSDLEGKEFENQKSYQLWHLLYAYEGDNSKTGNDKLYQHLKEKFGFKKEYAQALINVSFKDDYGNLSAKAIKKMMPYIKDGKEYSKAAVLAGYNHSHSITKEENENRTLKKTMELLPKNSLRNPVVEKILNQLVNVVNAIIKEYGKPDEIRIELARELKKSAKERAEMTSNIGKATKAHEEIKKKLKEFYPFNTGIRITRNDVIKYKLYEELASNGYKTLYTNTYIDKADLFTKKFDIEHIIPKATLFDDSFSNKTLSVRDFNRVKSNKTGIDAIVEKYGDDSSDFNRYKETVEILFKDKKISKAKHNKLLMKGSEIPDGFIERDLRNSQYIAKKAKQMLLEVCKTVVPTTGKITDKLRQDWQLINVLKELNWDKYYQLGLTETETTKDGKIIKKIQDWTKRNDHRHHAMDALTVAFTKHNHIQYFNYMNARKDLKHKKHANIHAIENTETIVVGENGSKKRLIKPPMPIKELRAAAKKHLKQTLISFKAKNKVVTKNKNKIKGKDKPQEALTPRGQLHKETIYGTSKVYKTKEEKVGPKFDRKKIKTVARKAHREALLKRLAEFDNDPKKAFGGKNALAKNPVVIKNENSTQSGTLTTVPEKVKLVWQETQYTIRKDITPELKLDKVIDKGTHKILRKRLAEFNGKPKEAFANLEENPIWLNKEKGIQLKRVTITGVNNAVHLHYKKDHLGKEILDENDKPIPIDFVSTGNNHHVAIYRDEGGKLEEKVVSFYEAVMTKNAGQPVIDKNYNHHLGWKFLFTMKQNEYFIFPNEDTGFNPAEIDLMDESNYSKISPNLFRVQKIATKNYLFTHHLETLATTGDDLKNKKQLIGKKYYFVQTPNNLENIIKVRLNHLGKIVHVGE